MAAAKHNTYVLNRKKNPQYTQAQIDDIITKLLNWAHSDDGIYIASFIYEEFKQPKSWIYNLARHHEDLEVALETTRELIAGKIANHSFKGDRNSTFGEKILPMYCKEYKALIEWKESLKQKELSEDEVKTIVKVIDYSTKEKKAKDPKAVQDQT
ncbi:MAG: hypothetical protein ACTSQE_12355 [Candidatus Heimdallarchaeaceae archaeon]